MNKSNSNNLIKKDFKFYFIQFLRRYSYWFYPLVIAILYSLFIILAYKKIDFNFLNDYKLAFVDGLFTLIGFGITIFTIIHTIDRKFYGNHLKPLCLNILFSIIFGLIGILSSLFPYGHIIILGFTLLCLTNFIIILIYIFVTAMKYQPST